MLMITGNNLKIIGIINHPEMEP